MAARPSIFHERLFRWFFIGESASLLGDGMAGVALSFAVLHIGSVADLGYVLAARTVPLIAVVLVGGVIADRLSRRLIMVTADVVRFVSQGTTAALLISGHARIWELAALQVVNGIATALFNPASTGLVPSIVAGDRLQEANALRGLAMSIGSIAGPALSGVIVAVTNPGWALAIDASSFAVSAIMLAGLRLPAHRPPPSSSFTRELLAGWAEFRSRTWLWTGVGYASLTNALFALYSVLGPVIAKRSFGGAAAWAVISAMSGTGSLLGGLVALRLRPRFPMRTAMLAAVFFPLPVLGLGARLPALAVAVLALVGGVGISLWNTLWETGLQRHVPHEALSRISAYEWLGTSCGQPVGQTIAGPLALAAGVYPTLLVAGGAQILVTFVTLAVPAIRRLPAHPAAPADGPRSTADRAPDGITGT